MVAWGSIAQTEELLKPLFSPRLVGHMFVDVKNILKSFIKIIKKCRQTFQYTKSIKVYDTFVLRRIANVKTTAQLIIFL